MQKVKTLIIGAGVGGLSVAGYLKHLKDEDFLVVERSESVPNNLSNGLHYLHDTEMNIPFHIDFKKCILTENIWDTRTNSFRTSATIAEMFEYSKKIMENLRHPSSIMDPGKRDCVYVPESNDMNELIQGYEDYIGRDKFLFGRSIISIDANNKIAKTDKDEEIQYEQIISTMSAPTMLNVLGIDSGLEFKNKALYITNYKSKNIVPNWMIVLYMSDPKFIPYRISVFNNIISMESLTPLKYEDEAVIKYVVGDLLDYDLNSKQTYDWETGRIFGIQKPQRKFMVEKLSEYDIYPIGRFGLWNGKLRIDTTIKQAERLVNNLSLGLKENAIKELYE